MTGEMVDLLGSGSNGEAYEEVDLLFFFPPGLEFSFKKKNYMEDLQDSWAYFIFNLYLPSFF